MLRNRVGDSSRQRRRRRRRRRGCDSNKCRRPAEAPLLRRCCVVCSPRLRVQPPRSHRPRWCPQNPPRAAALLLRCCCAAAALLLRRCRVSFAVTKRALAEPPAAPPRTRARKPTSLPLCAPSADAATAPLAAAAVAAAPPNRRCQQRRLCSIQVDAAAAAADSEGAAPPALRDPAARGFAKSDHGRRAGQGFEWELKESDWTMLSFAQSGFPPLARQLAWPSSRSKRYGCTIQSRSVLFATLNATLCRRADFVQNAPGATAHLNSIYT